MATVRPLLLQGNQKLSQAVFHWSLPAGTEEHCPGATALCIAKCYAQRGRYNFPQVQDRLEWCWEQARKPSFASRMVKEIKRRGAAFIVRIHCSGEFFDADYTHAWVRIIQSSPVTRFFAYTRSFRVPSIVPALEQLAKLENMQLWYSVDSHGMPVDVPPRVRLAYMQVDTEEEIPPEVSLIFRDYSLRGDPATSHCGVHVCPYDTPQGRKGDINCGVCSYCWKD